MHDIATLVYNFRKAINKAKELDDLGLDFAFKRFPHGCCGDASCLLAEYLIENGIKTAYVCGTYRGGGFENMQSHAWLLVDDSYIIDITGDQFYDNSTFMNYNKSVYVGEMDEFHKLFEVEDRDVYEFPGLSQLGNFCYPRLRNLYNIITKYL